MKTNKLLFTLGFLLLTGACATLCAQEAPRPEGPRPPFDRPEGRPPLPRGMDPERREREEPRRDMRPERGEMVPGMRMEGYVLSPFEANTVDQAHFQIASLLVEQKKYEDAIGELLKVADASPDETAAAAAHFSAGNIFRHLLKDADKAVEQYREVKGRLLEPATRQIIETYQEANRGDEAVKVLDDLLATTKDPRQKARLLNMKADVYRRTGKPDKAVETLRQITETISYDDAEAARRGWGNDEEELKKLQDEIEELRGAGRNEEADRLQKQADEIKNRLQMRDLLKKQKRADKEPPPPPAGVQEKK